HAHPGSPRLRLVHAVGTTASANSPVNRGTGGEDHRRHHHHRDRPDAGIWRHVWRLPPADPDRLRAQHRLRSVELLLVVLLVRRRGLGVMAAVLEQLDAVPGFTIPVHRALTEHILLGGAPRSIAIMNGTL